MAELVLALDLPDRSSVEALLDRVHGVRWAKVGSQLFTAAGPGLVELLRRREVQVFLDLKWHDIPNTVAGAVRAARGLGVAMATVHAFGGRAMIEAAAQAAQGELAIVAVTVLTSHDAASLGEAIGRSPAVVEVEVARLARLALAAGADGLVCSPLEVGALRNQVGAGPLLVTPGIRRPDDGVGDQSRVATAGAAARAGATHLVVGRPVLQAARPEEVWRQLEDELGR